MNVTRNVSLNCVEEIAGINTNYSVSYTNDVEPTTIQVSASKNEPGVDLRIYRTYTADGKFTPIPSTPVVGPFDKAFNDAVLVTVKNIFANYKTL